MLVEYQVAVGVCSVGGVSKIVKRVVHPDVVRERQFESRTSVICAEGLIAYNLGNLWRRLALPKKIENWSLTSLQQRLVKTGGRLVKHARYYWLLLAESHLTRRRFGAMLGRIAILPFPAG